MQEGPRAARDRCALAENLGQKPSSSLSDPPSWYRSASGHSRGAMLMKNMMRCGPSRFMRCSSSTARRHDAISADGVPKRWVEAVRVYRAVSRGGFSLARRVVQICVVEIVDCAELLLRGVGDVVEPVEQRPFPVELLEPPPIGGAGHQAIPQCERDAAIQLVRIQVPLHRPLDALLFARASDGWTAESRCRSDRFRRSRR